MDPSLFMQSYGHLPQMGPMDIDCICTDRRSWVIELEATRNLLLCWGVPTNITEELNITQRSHIRHLKYKQGSFHKENPPTANTVECCYNAVQHNMILHMVWQWLRQNMHGGHIHKRHPISHPHGPAMVCLLWGFGWKLTMLWWQHTIFHIITTSSQ